MSNDIMLEPAMAKSEVAPRPRMFEITVSLVAEGQYPTPDQYRQVFEILSGLNGFRVGALRTGQWWD